MAKKKSNTQTAPESAPDDPGVASEKANLALVHTDDQRDQAEQPTPAAPAGAEPVEIPEGTSATTRHDSTDLGAPMLPGSADEPVGPEDALGVGPKRGDYRERIVGSPHEGGVPQRPRAEQIGDEEGRKGGVETGS